MLKALPTVLSDKILTEYLHPCEMVRYLSTDKEGNNFHLQFKTPCRCLHSLITKLWFPAAFWLEIFKTVDCCTGILPISFYDVYTNSSPQMARWREHNRERVGAQWAWVCRYQMKSPYLQWIVRRRGKRPHVLFLAPAQLNPKLIRKLQPPNKPILLSSRSGSKIMVAID